MTKKELLDRLRSVEDNEIIQIGKQGPFGELNVWPITGIVCSLDAISGPKDVVLVGGAEPSLNSIPDAQELG